MVLSGEATKVEPAPEQPETLSVNVLVKTETLMHSFSGLGLGEAEEAMEVVPLDVLPASANVPTDVVQSMESTGVLAPKLEPGEISLRPNAVGEQELQGAFWSPPSSEMAFVRASPEVVTLRLHRMRIRPCRASMIVETLMAVMQTLAEERELQLAELACRSGYNIAPKATTTGEVVDVPEVVQGQAIRALEAAEKTSTRCPESLSPLLS